MSEQTERHGSKRRRSVRDFVRELLSTGSEEEVADYLTESFITSAMQSLVGARRQAGLTQAELAKRLNTSQPSVARLEADLDGGISLARYTRYLAHCGMVPLDLALVPIQSLQEYSLAHLGEPRTEIAYTQWQTANASSNTRDTPFMKLGSGIRVGGQGQAYTTVPGATSATNSQSATSSEGHFAPRILITS